MDTSHASDEEGSAPHVMEIIDEENPYRQYVVSYMRHITQRNYKTIATTLLIGLTFIFFICFLYLIREKADKYKSLSREVTNEYIRRQLNFNVDPCDDFYEFVCSKFEKETVIPEDKVLVLSYTALEDELNEQLRSILESNNSKYEIKPYKIMRSVYRTCMDIETLNQKGLSPLYEAFPDFEKWPIVDGDLEDFDWKDELIKYRNVDTIKAYLLSISIEMDSENSTKQIIQIDDPSLGIDREFLIEGYENNRVMHYYNFMINISNIMNNNENRSKPIKEIVDFEIELAKLTTSKEEKRNKSNFYHYQKLGDIDRLGYKMFQPMGFVNFIQRLFLDQNDTKMIETIKLNESEPVNNAVPNYIARLDEFLSKTPKRIIKNYLVWRYIVSKLTILDENMRNAILNYGYHVSGVKKREPRWKECIRTTKSFTHYTIHSAYVHKYFDEEKKAGVSEILENIKNEFHSILQNLNWMDTKTKEMALRKLDKMKSTVGYPEQLVDSCVIQNEYKYLDTIWKENDLFGSKLRLNKYETNKDIRKFRKPIDKSDWRHFSRVAVINAFYNELDNSMILPAGVLQGLFYNEKQPRAMNYGAIGTVIGHELTHGFDDEGSQYDEEGNLRDWWTPETKRVFTMRKNKIINQYTNFKDPISGLHLNGNSTQGENIADNAAVIQAYRALKKLNVTDENLTGFDFTEQQLYWISFGRVWCMAARKEEMITIIKTGMHSPGRFRTNGALQNNNDFAKDFKCKKGSYMNPENKNIVYG